MELREFSGAENPKIEEHLDSELQQKQDDWARMANRFLLENTRL
jgi:hypothetical protein